MTNELDLKRGGFLKTLQTQWLADRRGRTIAQIYDGIRISSTRWSDWLTGQRMTPKNRRKVAEFFDIDEIDTLSAGLSLVVSQGAIDQMVVIAKVLAQYESEHSLLLTPREREQIIRLLFALPPEDRTAEKILQVLPADPEPDIC